MTDLDKRKIEVEELREKTALIGVFSGLLHSMKGDDHCLELKLDVIKKTKALVKAIPFH